MRFLCAHTEDRLQYFATSRDSVNGVVGEPSEDTSFAIRCDPCSHCTAFVSQHLVNDDELVNTSVPFISSLASVIHRDSRVDLLDLYELRIVHGDSSEIRYTVAYETVIFWLVEVDSFVALKWIPIINNSRPQTTCRYNSCINSRWAFSFFLCVFLLYSPPKASWSYLLPFDRHVWPLCRRWKGQEM